MPAAAVTESLSSWPTKPPGAVAETKSWSPFVIAAAPNASETPSKSLRRGRRLPLPWLVAGIALGIVLSGIGSLLWMAWTASPADPPVTVERLEAAQRRWQENGPASYNLHVRLSGTRQAEIHLEVRNHRVVAMRYNGQTPSQRRVWETWTVPSQFEMIATDLENAHNRPWESFGVEEASQVVLRAQFDPQFGLPSLYERLVLGGSGDIRWEIVGFQPLDSNTPRKGAP
jgi:hypothetical protein